MPVDGPPQPVEKRGEPVRRKTVVAAGELGALPDTTAVHEMIETITVSTQPGPHP